jgi:transposase
MPRPKYERKTQAVRRQQMKQLYQEGMNLRQIAAAFNVTYQSVHQVLVRLGVRMRPRGGNRGSHSRRRK